MLLSADRFLRNSSRNEQSDREALLGCLDLWGITEAVQLVRDGVKSASALARELRRGSGIERVRDLLFTNFASTPMR